MAGKAQPQQGPRPVATFDHLKKKKARIVTDWIVLDDDAADRFDAAKRELQLATIAKDPTRLRAAEAEHAAAEKLMRENAVQIKMRAVGGRRWRELKADHKPTEKQLEEVAKTHRGSTLEFNPDTFPPVGIAASCIDPEMTADQVAELRDSEDWSENDFAQLVTLMMQANTQRRQVNFSF